MSGPLYCSGDRYPHAFDVNSCLAVILEGFMWQGSDCPPGCATAEEIIRVQLGRLEATEARNPPLRRKAVPQYVMKQFQA